MYWDLVGCIGISWGELGSVWHVLGNACSPCRVYWDPGRVYWDLVGCIGIQVGCIGISWGVLGSR